MSFFVTWSIALIFIILESLFVFLFFPITALNFFHRQTYSHFKCSHEGNKYSITRPQVFFKLLYVEWELLLGLKKLRKYLCRCISGRITFVRFEFRGKTSFLRWTVVRRCYPIYSLKSCLGILAVGNYLSYVYISCSI